MTPSIDRARQGFVYVPLTASGPMAQAEPGQTVRIPGRGPPWIVVDHELSSVVVARWPGRLWAVEIVDAVTPQDGAPRLSAGAGYTRAAAVRVLYAVSVATLFGARGEETCAVIEAAAALTLDQATRLREGRHRDAGAAQIRVWRRWLVRENIALDRYNDLDGTLAIGASKAGSPIGMAPRVIHGEVGRRAEKLAGPSVWLVDDADPEGAFLADPWCAASTALLDVALALGAPELVGQHDKDILTAAWLNAIGPLPT